VPTPTPARERDADSKVKKTDVKTLDELDAAMNGLYSGDKYHRGCPHRRRLPHLLRHKRRDGVMGPSKNAGTWRRLMVRTARRGTVRSTSWPYGCRSRIAAKTDATGPLGQGCEQLCSLSGGPQVSDTAKGLPSTFATDSRVWVVNAVRLSPRTSTFLRLFATCETVPSFRRRTDTQ
jgi:hypothetical protein